MRDKQWMFPTESALCRLKMPAGVIFLALCSLCASHATVVVDNTSDTASQVNAVGSQNGSVYADAAPFMSGTGNLDLVQVALLLDCSYVSLPGPENFKLQLWTDNSGLPGSLLTTFTGPSDHNSGIPNTHPGPVTFSTNYLLSSNTPYWLVASAPGNSSDKQFDWSATGDSTQTDASGWSIESNLADQANGGSWTYEPYGAQLQFSITAAPEPNLFAYLFTGLACMNGFRRLRK